MVRSVRYVVACLFVLCAVVPALASDEVDGPMLALHLVATYEYPSCSEMTPSSAAELKTQITSEELTRSKGYGNLCVLAHGVDGLTGAEFALGGMSEIPDLKVGRMEWCVEGALMMGDFLGGGGIVAFPCAYRLEGEDYILLGFLPFEYRGSRDLEVTIEPSVFTKPANPVTYVMDCTVQYSEHEVVRTSGAAIEAMDTIQGGDRRALRASSLLWGMNADGEVSANQLADVEAETGTAVTFPSAFVRVDGVLAGVNEKGTVEWKVSRASIRRTQVSEDGRRILLCSRSEARGTGDLEPWDVELLSSFGETVWRRPRSAHRAWVCHDGSAVASQKVGHAGAFNEPFDLWRQGHDEGETPALGLQEAAFLRDGSLVGWGKALPGVSGPAQVGEWGVFAVGPEGGLRWWNPVPEPTTGALGVSRDRIVLLRVDAGGSVTAQGWSTSGKSLFSESMDVPTARRGSGRLVAGMSPDGSGIALAWAPRGSNEFVLVFLDGNTGREQWRRNLNEDLREKGMWPGSLVFAKEGTAVGVLSVRMEDPPATAVVVCSSDGVLIWQRKKLRCFGQAYDLLLSASGDAILFVACGRAYLYQLGAEE